jgi:hypothetical protein
MEAITLDFIKKKVHEYMHEAYDFEDTPEISEKIEKFSNRIMNNFHDRLNYINEKYKGVKEYEELLDEIFN